MVEERNIIGLSREFIIHPGETLAEVIEDRSMSQSELAVRTGMTEKHISTVIHGQKNISPAFAKKLEYALGIEASFWMNLQAQYDRELLEFEDLHNITKEELSILKNLKEVTKAWSSFGWMDESANPVSKVIDYRKILGISNLLDIPKISYPAAYRAQTKKTTVDPYVLFAWQRMCELLTQDIEVADSVDLDKLRIHLPDIKHVMFLRANQIQKKLTALFAECGIAFRIVPHFTGAPVQGFIKESENGALILCMTIRQKFADIFWFTLFHEIAHILNGDAGHRFIDFDSVSGATETKADRMARDFLIDPEAYRTFIESEAYCKPSAVYKFAASQQVKEYIVEGRLMKEHLIPWSARQKYEWA